MKNLLVFFLFTILPHFPLVFSEALSLRGSFDPADYHLAEEPPLPEPILPDSPSNPKLLNMEKFSQNFILENRQIIFPQHPDAFNPSIIRWQGTLLLSFRVFNPETRLYPFGLVWLDEDFNPIGTPQLLQLPYHNPVFPSKQQDPRLIEVSGRLFMIYNNQQEDVVHREMRRMFIVEIIYDGEKFVPGTPECLLDYENKSEMRFEKNWVPFEYNGTLLLAHSIFPHRIYRPLLGKGACETVATTQGIIPWDWGHPRGGTQALFDEDHYIAFFHSWKDIPTLQSNGKKISHYVMGAYTFETHPPFALTAISPEPIVAKEFYRPPYYKTWKPLRCVFPAGILLDEDYIWVTYGRQDHEMWIAKFDKKALMQSLVPLQKIP